MSNATSFKKKNTYKSQIRPINTSIFLFKKMTQFIINILSNRLPISNNNQLIKQI